jgi:hypothetical protein
VRSDHVIESHAVKTYGGIEIKLHTCLTSVTDGGSDQLYASHVIPDERESGTHWMTEITYSVSRKLLVIDIPCKIPCFLFTKFIK